MKVFGSTVIETGRSRTWNPESGWQTTITYAGIAGAIHSLAVRLKAEGAAVDVQESGDGQCTLRATYGNTGDGADEEVQQTWEFPANVTSADILAHPLTLGLPDLVIKHLRELREGTLTRAPNSTISKSKDGQNALQWSSVNADANIVSVYGDNQNQDGLKLAKLILAGVESYQTSQLVVRVSTLVSTGNSIKAATTLANKLLTPTAFNSVMAPPNTIKIVLPTDGPFPAPAGWAYAYLVQQPDVSMNGPAKWRITQEFWWGLWSTTLYPVHNPQP